METTHTTYAQSAAPQPRILPADDILAAIRKRSFATVATTSPEGWPHAAGVLYAM